MRAVLLLAALCGLSAPGLPPLPPSPSGLEEAARIEVGREFERIGRQAPARDALLERAARQLVAKALESSTARAADPNAVSRAVAWAEGHDPSPRALLVRAGPPARAIAPLVGRPGLTAE